MCEGCGRKLGSWERGRAFLCYRCAEVAGLVRICDPVVDLVALAAFNLRLYEAQDVKREQPPSVW